MKALQIFRALLAVCNPLLQRRRVSRAKSHLEWLRFRGQCCGDGIALDGIEDRVILGVPGGMQGECNDQSDVCRVQLTVSQVRAGTHTGAGAIAVVRSAGGLAHLEVALGEEFGGVGEVCFIVVGSPGVLFRVSISRDSKDWEREEGFTMKKVVPAGICAPL